MRVIRRIIITFFITVLVTVIIFTSAWFILRTTIHGESICVPDISGKRLAVAMSILQTTGFLTYLSGEEPHSVIHSGYVIRQKPVAGTYLRSGRKIFLVISSGPQAKTFPEFSGQPLERALEYIESIGDVNIQVSQLSKFTDGVLIILAQSPLSSQSPHNGMGQVRLLIGLQKEDKLLIMPDVRGCTFNEAKRIFSQVDLQRLTVSKEVTNIVPQGTVFDQEPLPGTAITSSEPVLLSVTTGEISVSPKENYFHFAWMIPEGFRRNRVTVYTVEDEQRIERYTGEHRSGERIAVDIPQINGIAIEVHINGRLTYRETL